MIDLDRVDGTEVVRFFDVFIVPFPGRAGALFLADLVLRFSATRFCDAIFATINMKCFGR
jgi:hypothetical protein